MLVRKYAVSFEAGYDQPSESMEPELVVYGETCTQPECGFTGPAGFAFAGWLVGDAEEPLAAGEEITVEADVTLTATWASRWVLLQQEIDEAEDGATIVLDGDHLASSDMGPITIPAGKAITLDLNGHRLERNQSDLMENGNIITVNGSLILMDSGSSGTITGGCNTGSGGTIVNNGELTITGGTFTGNRALEAGAVYNPAGKKLTVTGGSFISNVATVHGGGVWTNGTLNLSGGMIVDNRMTKDTSNGGGVYFRGGVINLSGNPSIRSNTKNNMFLLSGYRLTIADPLSDSAWIGVTLENEGLAFTTGLRGKGAPAIFRSDNSGLCTVLNADGEAQLAAKPAFGEADLILPGSLSEIEASAFEGVAANIVFVPDGCQSIGDQAFKDCLSLTQIRIPEGCALGEGIFAGCGTVYVFGYAGSPAERYCLGYDNLVFVPIAD